MFFISKTILALSVVALFVTVQVQNVHAAALNKETVQSVMNEMGKINGTIGALLTENDGLVTVNNALIKENKLWEEQLNARIAPKETLFTAKAEAHIAQEARYTVIIKRHNDGCPDGVTVPRPQYERCLGETPYLEQITREHNAEKAVLQQEQRELMAERESYEKLIRDNNTKIQENYNRHVEIVDIVDDYNETLEYYRTRLVDLCAEADTDRDGEALHHCYSMQWDGAKQNLPTLDEILKGTAFFNN